MLVQGAPVEGMLQIKSGLCPSVILFKFWILMIRPCRMSKSLRASLTNLVIRRQLEMTKKSQNADGKIVARLDLMM